MTQKRNVVHVLAVLALTFIHARAQAQTDTNDVPQTQPKPSAEVNSIDPAHNTADAPGAPAQELGTPEETPKDLVPAGEAAKMAKRPVDKLEFKPGKGFTVTSADGDFSLAIKARAQLQYEIEDPDAGDPSNRFRLRRVRVSLAGNLFGKDNKYKLEIEATSTTPILDLYLDFTQNKNASVRVGQYKLASNRERITSSGDLQMVDRSIFSREFTLDRDMGIDLRSDDLLGKERMRYVLGVSMGQGQNNFVAQDFGMLYLARFEYLPFGLFDDFVEADLERLREFRLAFAATYSFFHRATRTTGNTGSFFSDPKTGDVSPEGGTEDFHLFLFDAMLKYAGYSLLGEFAIRDGERNRTTYDNDDDPLTAPIAVDDPRDAIGWLVQMGYLIPRVPLEFTGRVAHLHSFGEHSSVAEEHEVGGGINWYFARHPFKIQTDVFRLFEKHIKQGDTVFRVQLQASL